MEAAIAEEFSGEVEVETHIEPLQSDDAAGRDAPETIQADVASTLKALVRPDGLLRDVHDVRVRETPQGLVVNFHCRAEPTLTVDAIHRAVDDLERRLREERDDVHRAIGHAEPGGQ